ncbi:MAG: hypothetical protein J2P37_11815 [Ktedonobacteraceae bacterium]|jgi:glutamine amidotransferase-like uncharacterized protein|nr:hypothetical protein [Ktedonobacteraceae bacterium]
MYTTANTFNNPTNRPLALVYRGPAGCEGCSEAVAELLQSSRWNFDVQYVGPKERLQLSPATLQAAALYAQPGGSDDLDQAYRQLKGNAQDIRNYVASGGRYLGLCMGGYLAGQTPGFHLLPGDTDQFISSPGASVRTDDDTIVDVRWRGQPRTMYFQDGPFFLLDRDATNVTVLATYTNGKIAVLVAPYGNGKVGVSGPHPEANAQWYAAYNLVNPEGIRTDLGHDLIDTLMR